MNKASCRWTLALVGLGMFELKEREREMVHHMSMKLHCVVYAEAVWEVNMINCVCVCV